MRGRRRAEGDLQSCEVEVPGASRRKPEDGDKVVSAITLLCAVLPDLGVLDASVHICNLTSSPDSSPNPPFLPFRAGFHRHIT